MNLTFPAEARALAEQARQWLADNLEPPPPFANLDEEIRWGRGWQAKMAGAGWVGLSWPRDYGGRGASPLEVALFNAEYARSRAPQLVNRVGLNLAGPTLLAHGTPRQRARWLPGILDAAEIWCQLFSEPGAGSDLASLTTRAVADGGGGWRLTGQKVWTSYAVQARWGMCLARTQPDAPRHRGLSYLVVDMTAPGITVRPLRQITGESEFNEVFLDDVPVPADALIGGLGDGWRVANTTLAHERGTTFPIKEQVVHEVLLSQLLERAHSTGRLDDPLTADELAAVYVELRLLALANLRMLARLEQGHEPGPESSITKLLWTTMTQHLSELAWQLDPEQAATQRQFLWSKAAGIAGGTSEIQRTIIGERMLGLPRA